MKQTKNSNSSSLQMHQNISSNLIKQILFLLLILNYTVAKMKRFDADICECGSRCVGFGAKHCVRCCTTVMRRSVPISEYPMEQLKEAAEIKNVASTEEEKQQNELIENFLKNSEQKITNSRHEKRSDNLQTFIPSMLLDQANFIMEDKNNQIVRRRSSITTEQKLKQLQRLTTGKTNF